MEPKLRRTIRGVLAAAKLRGLTSLALPPMGAGYYGVPLADCARVMVEEIRDHLAGETSLTDVVVCAQDRREEEAFESLIGGRA
jgi:O-acetyl-ADP-ribose deacetylase (regulator of RNase III)